MSRLDERRAQLVQRKTTHARAGELLDELRAIDLTVDPTAAQQRAIQKLIVRTLIVVLRIQLGRVND